MSTSDLTGPEVLTIEEAAAILRISRNAAYATTHGRAGLPCIEIGRTIRVPRTSFDKLLNCDDATHVST